VTDLTRQTLSTSSTVLVHPSMLYVGAKRSSYFVTLPKTSQGDKDENVTFIVVDVDGKNVAGVAMEMKITQNDTVVHEQVFVSKRVAKNSKSAHEPIRFNLFADNFKHGDKLTTGPASIEVTITDNEGRTNMTKTFVYLAVEAASALTSRGHLNYNEVAKTAGENCRTDNLIVVPNKETFAVGDTARILISSPWKGKGQARSGIWSLWNEKTLFHSERFDFADGQSSYEVEFAIVESFIGRGSTAFSVDIVGEAEREGEGELPTRTACGHFRLPLDVPPVSRSLNAVIDAEETVRPGEETRVHVAVKDNDGNYVPNCSLCV
jgi:hypothetical protein